MSLALAHVQTTASCRRVIICAALLLAIGTVANTDKVFGAFQARAYDSGYTTIVTDPVGEQWEYVYQRDLGVPRLVSRISRTDGKGEARVYDANNNVVARTDGEGRMTLYSYNAANQKISMTEAAGTVDEKVTLYEYLSAEEDLLTHTTTASVATGFERHEFTAYDDNLNVTSTTVTGFDPAGDARSRTTTFQYDDKGRINRIDGPRLDSEDVTKLSYHDCENGGGCGQLAGIENALGHRLSYDAYDERGLLTRSTDALGVVTTWHYDLRNRVRRITLAAPGGEQRTTSLVHDNGGQLTSVTTADGATLDYTYDAAHNLQSITDSMGNVIEYTYDEKNNRVHEEIRDPLGQPVWWKQVVYDARDRVIETNVAGSRTQTLYDSVGNLIRRTDPRLNPATSYGYDALGRLRQTVDALSNPTELEYDTHGNPVGVSAPNGSTTRYEYDDLGNLLRETSPDRGVTQYSHDAAGNVVEATDARGVTVAYAYDALNRLVTMDYPGVEEDVTIVYDGCSNGVGRICSVLDPAGETFYEYDPWGNVTSETRIVEGVSYSTAYTYDNANRIMTMTYPSGRAVEYARDSLGRIIDVRTTVGGVSSDVVSGRTWRADGVLVSQRFGNDVDETRSYDLKGRMEVQNVGAIEARSYLFDPNDNLISLTHDDGSRKFGYDPLDRLISDVGLDSGTLPDLEYAYDANGNRVSLATAGSARSYAYLPGSNRLTSDGNKTVAHDPAGHRISARSGGKIYAYNHAGRLAAYAKNGEEKGAYVYDYLGRRTVKIKNGKYTIYHYDIKGQLIGESNGLNGRPKKDYVWAGDQPVLYAKVKRTSTEGLAENQRTYLVSDHLNTPRLGMDDAGRIVWRWDSDPFGQVRPDKDPDGDGVKVTLNLRFPGQYRDAESGLYYNWNRYYEPNTGRYITADTMGINGGLNLYSYALNRPTFYTDPLGLYTSARWLSGPSLGKITGKLVGDMGVGEYWTLIPPSIGMGGGWWTLSAQINGTVECVDDEKCNERKDVFSVNVELGKRIGIGYGITTFRWLQTSRQATKSFSGIRDAIEFYTNEWTQRAIKMARNPMAWCFVMNGINPG
ncbi:RHS repeat-associated core domain-containing protein [Pseudomonadota bacterium]